MKHSTKKSLITAVLGLATLLAPTHAWSVPTAGTEIQPRLHNPYEDIDWDTINQYKGAFHLHVRTNFHTVEEIVKRHEAFDYDIFARTEKRSWSQDDGQYAEKMLVIPGMESERGKEHAVHLFKPGSGHSNYDDVEATGGIQWRAHPHDPGRPKYSFEEMVEQFETYDTMIGLEIISRNHKPRPGRGDSVHPHRRGEGNYVRASLIWDRILAEHGLLDVYGIGATDGYNNMTPEEMPKETFFGDNIYNTGWTRVLAYELTEEAVYDAMKRGHMFWVSNMDASTEPPNVKRIAYDNTGIELDIDGKYDEVRWIYKSEVIHTGKRFDFVGEHMVDGQNYVRFEIWSNTGDFYESDIVGSQAFGVPQR
jgi:hypothetical protein